MTQYLQSQSTKKDNTFIPVSIIKLLENMLESSPILAVINASFPRVYVEHKYANAMPLYRQEEEWKRLGVNLTRKNLSNWTIKAGSLLKLLESELKIELLSNDVLHAEECTLEVLHEPGRESTSKSYMWLYRTSKNICH